MLTLIQNVLPNLLLVLVGSVSTLIGVLWSNRSHHNRLQTQLAHDSDIKAIERKSAMRRDVYLNAAAELTKAYVFISSLPQMDLAKINMGDGLQGFFISTAKLGLVAEDSTNKSLNELVSAYNALLFKMMARLSPINRERIQIDIINREYDEVQSEIKGTLQEMKNWNESGSPDGKPFSVLRELFDLQQKRAKELTDRRDECWKKANKETKSFSIQLMEGMKHITTLQIPVMIGIRKELDIETDEDEYAKMINSSAEKARQQLDDFLAELEQQQ